MLAGRWPAYLGRPSPDGSLLALLSFGDGPLDPSKSEEALRIGLATTLKRLEQSGAACRRRRGDAGVSLLGAAMPVAPAVAGMLDAPRGGRCAARSGDARGRERRCVERRRAHVRSAVFLLRRRFCYPTHGQTVMFSDPQH